MNPLHKQVIVHFRGSPADLDKALSEELFVSYGDECLVEMFAWRVADIMGLAHPLVYVADIFVERKEDELYEGPGELPGKTTSSMIYLFARLWLGWHRKVPAYGLYVSGEAEGSKKCEAWIAEVAGKIEGGDNAKIQIKTMTMERFFHAVKAGEVEKVGNHIMRQYDHTCYPTKHYMMFVQMQADLRTQNKRTD